MRGGGSQGSETPDIESDESTDDEVVSGSDARDSSQPVCRRAPREGDEPTRGSACHTRTRAVARPDTPMHSAL